MDYLKVKIDIAITDKASFQMYNTLGQSILQLDLLSNQEEHHVNLTDIEKGIYFYEVVGNGLNRKSGKLIVLAH